MSWELGVGSLEFGVWSLEVGNLKSSKFKVQKVRSWHNYKPPIWQRAESGVQSSKFIHLN